MYESADRLPLERGIFAIFRFYGFYLNGGPAKPENFAFIKIIHFALHWFGTYVTGCGFPRNPLFKTGGRSEAAKNVFHQFGKMNGDAILQVGTDDLYPNG